MKSNYHLSLISAFALPFLSSPLGAADSQPPATGSPDVTTNGYAGKPYSGQPWAIPGIIQAEDYDVAPGNADGVTLYSPHPHLNNALRPTGDRSVGIVKFTKGYVTTAGELEDTNQWYLGYTVSGQWMKYSVQVAESGTYQIGGHFACGFTNRTFSMAFAPGIKPVTVPVPTTAGYQPKVEVYHVFEKIDNLAEVTFPAGNYVMTVMIGEAGETNKTPGLNIDYFSFTKKP